MNNIPNCKGCGWNPDITVSLKKGVEDLYRCSNPNHYVKSKLLIPVGINEWCNSNMNIIRHEIYVDGIYQCGTCGETPEFQYSESIIYMKCPNIKCQRHIWMIKKFWNDLNRNRSTPKILDISDTMLHPKEKYIVEELSISTVNTFIYTTFEEFSLRDVKSINGVSPTFADDNPDYISDNQTNKGCWNCKNCKNCVNYTNTNGIVITPTRIELTDELTAFEKSILNNEASLLRLLNIKNNHVRSVEIREDSVYIYLKKGEGIKMDNDLFQDWYNSISRDTHVSKTLFEFLYMNKSEKFKLVIKDINRTHNSVNFYIHPRDNPDDRLMFNLKDDCVKQLFHKA